MAATSTTSCTFPDWYYRVLVRSGPGALSQWGAGMILLPARFMPEWPYAAWLYFCPMQIQSD